MIECMKLVVVYFFFNDTATTEIYTLSLHDALPILINGLIKACQKRPVSRNQIESIADEVEKIISNQMITEVKSEYIGDRKSTRLNSSHANISYAVFCLKKKTIKYCIY